MAKFTYNNTKNASTGHMLLELNYSYHLQISFEEDTHPFYQSKIADKLLIKLEKLITVSRKNPHHTQKLQKQAQNTKNIKLKSYVPSNKVWSNNKYIKIKQN